MSRIDDINNSNLDGALKGVLISNEIDRMKGPTYVAPKPVSYGTTGGSGYGGGGSSSSSGGEGGAAVVGLALVAGAIWVIAQAVSWFLDNWVAATPVFLAFVTPLIAFWIKHRLASSPLFPAELLPAANVVAIATLSAPSGAFPDFFLYLAYAVAGGGAAAAFVLTLRNVFDIKELFDAYDFGDAVGMAFQGAFWVLGGAVALVLLPGLAQLIASLVFDYDGLGAALVDYWAFLIRYGLFATVILFLGSFHAILALTRV